MCLSSLLLGAPPQFDRRFPRPRNDASALFNLEAESRLAEDASLRAAREALEATQLELGRKAQEMAETRLKVSRLEATLAKAMREGAAEVLL